MKHQVFTIYFRRNGQWEHAQVRACSYERATWHVACMWPDATQIGLEPKGSPSRK